MFKPQWLTLLVICIFLFVALTTVGATQAQDGNPNPTPIVIPLTPPGQATAVFSPTPDGDLFPDRFEPNNDVSTATAVGWQMETDLTLTAGDVDYFTGYLKAGQMVQLSTTVYEGLDTRLALFWNGSLVIKNDDRAAGDVGSAVTFTAPTDGWYVALVEKATVYNGRYDLEIAQAEPSATPTAAPTLTPTPSPTPLVSPDLAEPNDTAETAWSITPGMPGGYTLGVGDVDYFTFIAKAGNHYVCETLTEQVDTLLTVLGAAEVIGVNDDSAAGRVDSYLAWTAVAEQPIIVKIEARGGSFGEYELFCQAASPLPPPVLVPVNPVSPAPLEETPLEDIPVTASNNVTTTDSIPLSVMYIGRAQPETALPQTHIRLLVYYDANNDRQPGPGEGIANVSVLAVDGLGQRIARVFTNVQGEAVFNLASDAVARVIVPFVPGWSARVRAGEANSDIVLGLPAVRLPVFLPVQQRVESE